jgi:hypothetical protein
MALIEIDPGQKQNIPDPDRDSYHGEQLPDYGQYGSGGSQEQQQPPTQTEQE